MNTPTTSTWKIDPGHSAIQFKVKHLAIANVSGVFSVFSGTVQTAQDDFADAQVHVVIDAGSLGTNNEVRDTHLKSDIFFDVQQFPQLTFRGTLHKLSGEYALTGLLTIRGVAKQISLATALTGTGKGRWGDTRAGFELTGRINRTDFGLTWNMPTELGGLLLGEDIQLHMDIELIKEEAAVPAEATV